MKFYFSFILSIVLINISYCAVGGSNWNVNINSTNYSASASLGTVNANTLNLKGGWCNSWQNNGDDVCHGIIEYSVSGGGPSGSLIIDYVSSACCNPGDKYHSKQDYAVNISSLPAGMYTLTANYRLFGRWGGVTCGTAGNANEFTTGVLQTLSFSFTIVAAPLPVTWGEIKVKNIDASDIITYSILEAKNVDKYVLQISEDAEYWSTVNETNHIEGITHYSIANQYPPKSNRYYRIAQYDLDGNSSYSKVVSISNADNEVANMLVNGRNLIFDKEINDASIINAQGQQIAALKNVSSFELSSDLPAGLFYIRIRKEGKFETMPFIIY